MGRGRAALAALLAASLAPPAESQILYSLGGDCASLEVELTAIAAPCCGARGCPRGVPAECSGRCAASWATFYAKCARRIAAAPNHAEFEAFQASCPSVGGSADAAQAADRAKAAVLGAFTADAAAMPFHWIYSQSQISSTLRGADPEFYGDPQCRWYDYSTGELSPFGQQGMVYLRTIAGSDAKADVSYVDPVEIADAYYAFYSGRGECASSSVCYHDTCTRGFVRNMGSGRAWPSCGSNDDQDEAITHILPVVVR